MIRVLEHSTTVRVNIASSFIAGQGDSRTCRACEPMTPEISGRSDIRDARKSIASVLKRWTTPVPLNQAIIVDGEMDSQSRWRNCLRRCWGYYRLPWWRWEVDAVQAGLEEYLASLLRLIDNPSAVAENRSQSLKLSRAQRRNVGSRYDRRVLKGADRTGEPSSRNKRSATFPANFTDSAGSSR